MYRELAAPRELRRYIQCFWVHEVGLDEPALVHRICRMAALTSFRASTPNPPRWGQ